MTLCKEQMLRVYFMFLTFSSICMGDKQGDLVWVVFFVLHSCLLNWNLSSYDADDDSATTLPLENHDSFHFTLNPFALPFVPSHSISLFRRIRVSRIEMWRQMEKTN
ncbi:hypothetical protein OIU79_002972 [Salix purpurea]|uniref:Uncharacterized protein n=1 Tax=Salix purpurea TaxID=77065 RepID=A0A9Q0UKE2_SALPP|nr:hypothetical protein OIU79_002972 [Salix purpurea]KAJ6731749.1 hypothetical protein OIU79_002972 [Salix purpurea]KAJ6731750.1 hypothetical protein OIU79_002972 [Salix purpurea]